MVPLLADLRSDVRVAGRQLRKQPLPIVLAVLMLALGIGANTAVFSAIDSIVLEPLPYPRADRVVLVFETLPDGGWNSVAGGAYLDWVEHQTHFEHLALYEWTEQNLTGLATPERVSGLRVSANYLPALGIEPVLGRGFAPGDDRGGEGAQSLVLTHRFWTTHLGGARDVLGTVLMLDQVPHTVVGVLPAGLELENGAEYLAPVAIGHDPSMWRRSGHWRSVIGRLATGATVDQAATELRAIKRHLNDQYPEFKQDWSVAVVPAQEAYVREVRPLLGMLFGTVTLVLLIACANVSNLLLARGHSRARELAVRSALGAHRWRIVRQMLVESLLLALIGCGLGLLVAQFAIDLLAAFVVSEMPLATKPMLDVTVLLFTAGLSCACGLLFGLFPALRAAGHDTRGELKDSARGSLSASKRRAQTWLVAGQYALTAVLLIAAGLLLRSFAVLVDVDPGFEPERVLACDLSLPEAKYPTPSHRLAAIEALKERLSELPGVETVGTTFAVPLGPNGRTERARASDAPERDATLTITNFVDDAFFDAMGMTLVRGRPFSAAENSLDADRAALVDSLLADALYPSTDPIGRGVDVLGERWTIVGVVAPIRQIHLDVEPRPTVYVPQAHFTWNTSLVVRSTGQPALLTEAVRAAVLDVDSDQPIANVRTLAQAVDASLARRRAILGLLGLFAAVALGLACLGIYGLLSFTLSQRVRELGIRAALGADRGDLLRLVLGSGLRTSVTGIAVGLAVAVATAGLLESFLYRVEAHDPVVFLGAGLLLVVFAAGAMLMPARRAARTEPTEALREA
ncbi:MAG: ABC transporter permease [Acidobacteriota bacterium]